MCGMSLGRESLACAAGTPNKALHRTATPLRSVAAAELGRYVSQFQNGKKI